MYLGCLRPHYRLSASVVRLFKASGYHTSTFTKFILYNVQCTNRLQQDNTRLSDPRHWIIRIRGGMPRGMVLQRDAKKIIFVDI